MNTQARSSVAAPGSTLARADRQLARSVLALFVLASAVAVLGPLLSYRSDVAQLQDLFRTQVVRSAMTDADVLNKHLRVLQAELQRMAARPEIDLLDASMRPEQELLDAAHRQSTLFDSGVAIVDAWGKFVWSEPAELKTQGVGRAWFQRLPTNPSGVIDVASPARQTFLVAVPVMRGGKVTGALVGFSQPLRSALPSGAAEPGAFVRVVVDATGGMTTEETTTEWGPIEEVLKAIKTFSRRQGSIRLNSGRELFAASEAVGESGLKLVVIGSEADVTAPVRHRFLLQMILLTSLQIGAVLLLSVFLRRIYGRFLEVERAAVEHERLLSLGSAASLIAHEVKNSLNGLQAATTLLSPTPGEASAPPETTLAIKSIRGEVDRLKHLASSLLLFGKPASVQLQPTDLPGLVQEVVDGLRVLPEWEEVVVSMQCPASLDVPCDPLLLATAVHNLVRNAIEAAVGAKDLGRQREPSVVVRVAREGRWALVEVNDNAGGPSAVVEARLFEPFVTGKPKGIGLGLSMTRRALESQGGSVTFERTSVGSRFMIRLPVASSEQAPIPGELLTSRGVHE
jgi:signal transduction histidine kinase